MSNPLLEVNNLNVHFPSHDGTAEVINGIDLQIGSGEIIGLVGETGCGKSVTAKTILGLLTPPQVEIPNGSIEYKGENLMSMTKPERKKLHDEEMSMIMQDPMTSLNPVLTIGEQMVDVLKWSGKSDVDVFDIVSSKLRRNDSYNQTAIEYLKKVNIAAPERVFSSYPIQLSGGMRQRVMIAIALISEPNFLIADEPGTALDVTTEAKIHDLLLELMDDVESSMLYITHDLGVAKKLCDRVYIMYAGEIIEEASTQRLFKSPKHPYTYGLLDSVPTLSNDMGEGIEGHLPDYKNPPNGCRFADRCPHSESECHDNYPYRRELTKERSVACHIYDGEPIDERHESIKPKESIDIKRPPEFTEPQDAFEEEQNNGN